jgi:hypothetical protein
MMTRSPSALPSATHRCGAVPSSIAVAIVLAFCNASARPAQAQITRFASGMVTPETITVAPAGFGAYAGDYIISDGDLGNSGGPIWALSADGTTLTQFATNVPFIQESGLFLGSNWGAYSGDYLLVGLNGIPFGSGGSAYAYDSSGNGTELFSLSGDAGLTDPIIAPNTFGSYGGDVIATSQDGDDLFVLSPDGTDTTLGSDISSGGAPFGEIAAPAGFGSIGGDILVSDATDGDIWAVAPDGTSTLFASVPLGTGQIGLRQMAFSPAGYISGYGSLLFVSISGSTNGGGTAGDVYALDSSGNVVESLRGTAGYTSFDPRGLLFPDSDFAPTNPTDTLYISDASDPIDIVTPQSFQQGIAAPEPSSFALTGMLLPLAGFVLPRLRKRRGA